MDDRGKASDRTTMQIAMSVEDKRALKRIAAMRGMTVARLVHEWVEEMRGREGLE